MDIILSGSKPLGEDIVDSISRYIRLGLIKENEQLPSVRDLALSLSVNPNTVVHAYEKLVDKGMVYSLPKKGYFVKGVPIDGNKEVITSSLNSLINLGISTKEIQSVLNDLVKKEAHHD
jgi:GntR family transcriptional regulator